MMKLTNTIPHPDADRAVKLAQKELETRRREIESANSAISVARGKLDAVHGQLAVGGNDSDGVRKALLAEIDAARTAKSDAKARVPDLEAAARDARAKACRKICSDLRPSYVKTLKSYALAVLNRLAPEIAAAESLVSVRDELEARRIGFSGLPQMPFSDILGRPDERYAKLRADTADLINAGVLDSKDLPGDLAKIWSLK